ncbi:MAG: DNA mismatch repair endonuclease MutL [Holosporaceae bacterium]|jgi:DNA mismatch repair protein MutL|nr:DNA mismatch repair endonuclease MutL [Holosporaceae bacterium]
MTRGYGEAIAYRQDFKGAAHSKIQLLSQNLINQIAAGEVIERPSSVIKELIENSIDAKASEIVVKVVDAGKSFISISDNGEGMDKEELELCVLSHATSKLSSENLFDIHTFGFRGEALPSIASVSRLSIVSANSSSMEAWMLSLEGARNLGLSPASRQQGTTIEVRDLFFATPARLKFLKSDASELDSCCEVFHRSALAFPHVSFQFFDGNKRKFYYEKTDDPQKRLRDVMGESFAENTFAIDAEKDGLRLHGMVGVPTFNKSSANYQYFFVNNRFVKDKNFAYALKSAYSGLVPNGRYAAAVLFLDMPYNEVDVNAHPAKVEIRFRESEKVRFFILSELKKALTSFGAMKVTTEIVDKLSVQKKPSVATLHEISYRAAAPKRFDSSMIKEETSSRDKFFAPPVNKTPEEPIVFDNPSNKSTIGETYNVNGSFSSLENELEKKSLLGNAICQISNTYIVAENGDSLVIVDQHAAAERITLEKLKNNLSLDSQTLLLPEICPMKESQIEQLEKNAELLLKFGIHCEKMTDDLVQITAIPAILGSCDAKSLLSDVAEELTTFGDAYSMEEKIHHILSTISCHGSLRAGKKLSIFEMNSLLRQMEKTENVAQCCHGRPSYTILSIDNLKKFFERC